MAKRIILINCSNLNYGGGVSVASSFIDCLSKESYKDISIELLLSEKVYKTCVNLGVNFKVFYSVRVKNIFGLKAVFFNFNTYFSKADLIFTVFGPFYRFITLKRNIVGLAEPYLIYEKNNYLSTISFISVCFLKIKSLIKFFFISKSDVLIVERDVIKKRMSRKFKGKRIYSVSSSIHRIYHEKNYWSHLEIPKQKTKYRIGVLSRNYPHKNLSLLPEVKRILLNDYNLSIEIIVTFSEEEWISCSNLFRREITNIGTILLSQCPEFYKKMDGILLPTLLESFSAVPIEAMFMKKPFFGSNLEFMKDVCEEHCLYFNPLIPKDIASTIFKYFSLSKNEKNTFINNAYNFALKLPSPELRCKKYMKILQDNLNVFE